jgi:hypothetical protein
VNSGTCHEEFACEDYLISKDKKEFAKKGDGRSLDIG